MNGELLCVELVREFERSRLDRSRHIDSSRYSGCYILHISEYLIEFPRVFTSDSHLEVSTSRRASLEFDDFENDSGEFYGLELFSQPLRKFN
jgi:hypothetical protein